MLDTSLAGECRQPLSLYFFPLDTRFPGILDAKHTPGSSQRSAESPVVVEIPFDESDTRARQRCRRLAFRLAGQAAQPETVALQRLRNCSALMARHSGNENCSIVRHSELAVHWAR